MNLFIFFLSFLINYSLSSYCGSYLPKDSSTCDKFDTTDKICCHLQGNFNGAPHSMCYPFSRDIYYSLSRSIELNGYRYKLNCGIKRGTSCGQIVNPQSYKDYSISSKKSNSCCFYRYKTQTNCVWLGTSDVGTMQYKDLLVICSGNYLKFSFVLVLILIFFL